jgi:hypothetical protein
MALDLFFQEILNEYDLEGEDLVVVVDNAQVHPTQRVFFESSCSTMNESNSSHLFQNSTHSHSSSASPSHQKWNPLKDSVVGFANANKNRWGHHSASSNTASMEQGSMSSSASFYSADLTLSPPARTTEVDLLPPPASASADSSLAPPARRTSPDIDGLVSRSSSASADSSPSLPARRISLSIDLDDDLVHNAPSIDTPSADSSPAFPARRISPYVDVDRAHYTPAGIGESSSDRLISPPARRPSHDTSSLSFVPDLGNDDEIQEKDKVEDKETDLFQAFSLSSIPDVLNDGEESDDYEDDKSDSSGSDEYDDENNSADMDLSIATFEATPPCTPQKQMQNLRKSILTSPNSITPSSFKSRIPAAPPLSLPFPPTLELRHSERKLPEHTNSFELNRRKCSRRASIIVVGGGDDNNNADDEEDSDHDSTSIRQQEAYTKTRDQSDADDYEEPSEMNLSPSQSELAELAHLCQEALRVVDENQTS